MITYQCTRPLRIYLLFFAGNCAYLFVGNVATQHQATPFASTCFSFLHFTFSCFVPNVVVVSFFLKITYCLSVAAVLLCICVRVCVCLPIVRVRTLICNDDSFCLCCRLCEFVYELCVFCICKSKRDETR